MNGGDILPMNSTVKVIESKPAAISQGSSLDAVLHGCNNLGSPQPAHQTTIIYRANSS
jgi:hypothetical protein